MAKKWISEAPIIVGLFFIPIAKFDWLPEPYILSKWLIIYVATLLALLSLFLFAEKDQLPVLPKNLIYLLALLGFGWLFNRVFHHHSLYSQASLHVLSFVLLSTYFSWFFKNHKLSEYSLLCAGISITVVTVVWGQEYFSYLMTANITDINLYSSTFGNINMLGQFGLFGLVGLFCYLEKNLSRPSRILATTLFFIILTMIFTSNNRSIYIAGTVLILISLALGKKLRLKNIRLLSYSVGFFVILNLLGQVNWKALRAPIPEPPTLVLEEMPQGEDMAPSSVSSNSLFVWSQPYTLSGKTSSTRWRREILLETLTLIRAVPMGLGTNNFEFGFIPFELYGYYSPRENLILRSPHNEFLRIIAEEGLPFSIILLIFILFLGKQFLRSSRVNGAEKYIVSCLGLVFLVEMCFQFPLELPFPFFLAAGVLGFLVAKIEISEHRFALSPMATRTVFALAFVTFSMLSHGWFESNFYRDTQDSLTSAQSCNAMVDNWRSCDNHAANLLADERYGEAENVILDELNKRRYNYVALKQWIRLMAVTDPPKICRGYWVYQSIFGGKSSLSREYGDFCKDGNVLKPDEFIDAYDKFIMEISASAQ